MTDCTVCGEVIEELDLPFAHWPHTDCRFEQDEVCRCDAVTHPACCPECHPLPDHGEREEHAA